MSLLFLGKKARGKTTYISKHINDLEDNRIGFGNDDGTTKVHKYDAKTVFVIDTPGLNEEEDSRAMVLNGLFRTKITVIGAIVVFLGKMEIRTADNNYLRSFIKLLSTCCSSPLLLNIIVTGGTISVENHDVYKTCFSDLDVIKIGKVYNLPDQTSDIVLSDIMVDPVIFNNPTFLATTMIELESKLSKAREEGINLRGQISDLKEEIKGLKTEKMQLNTSYTDTKTGLDNLKTQKAAEKKIIGDHITWLKTQITNGEELLERYKGGCCPSQLVIDAYKTIDEARRRLDEVVMYLMNLN